MKSILVANWKMNPATYKEAKKLFDATKKAADTAKNISIIVAPPSIYLRELSSGYKGKRIAFAVQNASAEPRGAFTGEISLAQAHNAKASYVIVGHSERRALGETNDDTRKKVAAALGEKMTPILCVGERERLVGGEHFNFVREQLLAGLADVSAGKINQIFVAYEPIWAIGGERTMDPREMHEMSIFIRKSIVETHGDKAMSIRILYGGSANEQNAAPMLRDGDVAGLLVGHVSIDSLRFTALLESIE